MDGINMVKDIVNVVVILDKRMDCVSMFVVLFLYLAGNVVAKKAKERHTFQYLYRFPGSSTTGRHARSQLSSIQIFFSKVNKEK